MADASDDADIRHIALKRMRELNYHRMAQTMSQNSRSCSSSKKS